jgi:hypothetical protein
MNALSGDAHPALLTAARSGAIALRLLEPHHSQIVALRLYECIPLLSPHSIALNSCTRLQRLTIDYLVSESFEPSVLDPDGIISFLYPGDSTPAPLKYVSSLGLHGEIPRMWDHLPYVLEISARHIRPNPLIR